MRDIHVLTAAARRHVVWSTVKTAPAYSVHTRGLGAELFPALGGELVVLGFAVVLGESPLGLEPAALLHAVEGGVERALFDLESLVGGLADPGGDGVAVSRPPREGLEDQEVERALEEIEIDGRHAYPLKC